MAWMCDSVKNGSVCRSCGQHVCEVPATAPLLSSTGKLVTAVWNALFDHNCRVVFVNALNISVYSFYFYAIILHISEHQSKCHFPVWYHHFYIL